MLSLFEMCKNDEVKMAELIYVYTILVFYKKIEYVPERDDTFALALKSYFLSVDKPELFLTQIYHVFITKTKSYKVRDEYIEKLAENMGKVDDYGQRMKDIIERVKASDETDNDKKLFLDRMSSICHETAACEDVTRIIEDYIADLEKREEACNPDDKKRLDSLEEDDNSEEDDNIKNDKRVYKLCKKELGKEHPYTILTLSNLACSYIDANDREKAAYYGEKAYDLSRKVFGEEDGITITIIQNLAISYEKAHDIEKAKDYLAKAYELSKKMSDQDPKLFITILYNFAAYYGKNNNIDKAREKLDEAYELVQKTIKGLERQAIQYNEDDNMDKEREWYEDIAKLYEAAGKIKEARELKEQLDELNKKSVREERS